MTAVALIALGIGWIGGVWFGNRTGYAAGVVAGLRRELPAHMRMTIHRRGNPPK